MRVNSDNVFVVKILSDLDFVNESLLVFRAVCEIVQNQLDRHLTRAKPVLALISGEIHMAHSPRSKPSEYFVPLW